ncbi:MAG: SLBB domain-containing protein [Actinobacteria bacterium]|nr:SLBB domain-containing protein [Actinomycetota bacterium]
MEPFDAGRRLLPDEPILSLDDYLARGGGQGLTTALQGPPDEVIRAVSDSGLRGRGGAGFPTGIKWSSVRKAGQEDPDSTVYMVANAAEGEPGTYKDRAIMTTNPYQFVEGVLIAMYAVGAERGYIAIKKKFKEQIQKIADAVGDVAEAGWEGADRVDLVGGPDEYLFGEEKAMLEVVEGKLPMPRLVAPYQVGLFASMQSPNPTLVNNVESLTNVPLIVSKGPQWFREVGTGESPGTMVFTVVGDVESPGVYELPLGTPLRTLVEDIAGATDVKAIFGGVAQAVITPDMLDTPMGFDSLAEAGAGLGSGGFVVYDSSHCIVRVMAMLSHFLAVESCGQCWACMLGTETLTDILNRIDRGDGVDDDVDALLERAAKVTDQNRCYLPVGEQLMVGSTLHRYAEEYSDHIGRPCWSEREAMVPKIDSIDLDTGEVVFDQTYHLKQPDWTYAQE